MLKFRATNNFRVTHDIIFVSMRVSYHFPSSTGVTENTRFVLLSSPFPSPPLFYFPNTAVLLKHLSCACANFYTQILNQNLLSIKRDWSNMKYLNHTKNLNLSETLSF